MMESEVMAEKLPRVIRLKDVVGMTGLARSTIYDRMDRGSPRYDESFPRPIRLGSNSVGWIELAIVSWINSRVTIGEMDRDR
ncbi:AlpA family phage regulatory protein [Pseudomonas sp.]|uniref:helix-turn-helix transcriptional regulator n=1 Tax=Pseudomonas sp. TaxID=306 RepID=UPI0028A9305E|nr:AlpA family phage regulatory protein [Pseudomonas sp.]